MSASFRLLFNRPFCSDRKFKQYLAQFMNKPTRNGKLAFAHAKCHVCTWHLTEILSVTMNICQTKSTVNFLHLQINLHTKVLALAKICSRISNKHRIHIKVAKNLQKKKLTFSISGEAIFAKYTEMRCLFFFSNFLFTALPSAFALVVARFTCKHYNFKIG